jgi:uncharacterized membrane protein
MFIGKQTGPPATGGHNVGDTERRLSLVGALVLTAWSARRQPTGVLVGALGAWLGYRAASGHCPAYGRLGRTSAQSGDRGLIPAPREAQISTSVTIERSPGELYRAWHGFTHLPAFMKYIRDVRTVDEGRTHWVAQGPLGGRVEWDAEVTQDVQDERIAWQSVAGSDIRQAGEIRFRPAPSGYGTEVHLAIRYAPATRRSRAVATLIRALGQQGARADLKRFKRLMEAGEIPTNATAGQQAQPAATEGASGGTAS